MPGKTGARPGGKRSRMDDILHAPEMIALCTNCKRIECTGMCTDTEMLSAELLDRYKSVIVRTDANGNVDVYDTLAAAAAASGLKPGSLGGHIAGYRKIKACAKWQWQRMRAEDAQRITGGI